MIQATIDSAAVLARLAQFGPRIQANVERSIRQIVIEGQSEIVRDKLHGGNPLFSRSGNLARAVQQEVSADGDAITGTIGVDRTAPYGAVHEYGGTFDVREHISTSRLGKEFTLVSAVVALGEPGRDLRAGRSGSAGGGAVMAIPSVLDFEAIFAASFALFADVSGLKTSSRRLVTWDKVSPEDQPALFQREMRFTAIRADRVGMPAKWQLFGEVVIYANAGSDPGIIPSQALNALINQVRAIFEPGPNARQTLGIPNVLEAVIVGDVLIDEGVTDGQSIALIPFRITAH